MKDHDHRQPECPPGGDDRADTTMHEALGALGPMLDVPADPSADDLARWTAEDAPAPLRLHGGEARRASGGLLRRRLTRFCSAAAAIALAAGGVYLVFGNSSSAQASTILKALRTSTFSGLHVKFKNVKASGFEASGEAWASFGDDLTASELFDGGGASPKAIPLLEARSLSLRAHITGNDESQMPGLVGDIAVAMKPDESWAHFQSSTPEAVSRRLGPSSEPITASLPSGVLVLFGGTAAQQGMPMLPPGVDLLEGVDLSKPGVQVKTITMSDLATGAAVPVRGAVAPSTSAQVMLQIGSGGADGGAGAGGGDVAAQLMPLLRGQAGVTQLQQFAQHLTGAGGTGRVTTLNDGSSLLTIQGEPGVGGKAFATTMTVSYREGSGVQWIEFLGVGDAAGSSVRIEAFSGAVPADLLEPGQLVTEKTLKLDLRGN